MNYRVPEQQDSAGIRHHTIRATTTLLLFCNSHQIAHLGHIAASIHNHARRATESAAGGRAIDELRPDRLDSVHGTLLIPSFSNPLLNFPSLIPCFRCGRDSLWSLTRRPLSSSCSRAAWSRLSNEAISSFSGTATFSQKQVLARSWFIT